MIHAAPPARITRDQLLDMDRNDPLAAFRDAFVLPAGIVYLDGNSLGALPRSAPERLETVIRREWGETLVRAWNQHDWIGMPLRVGSKIARLVGARPQEVVVADSTSVNLFKLLAAALRLRPGRRFVVAADGDFPSDLYVAQGLIELLGGGRALRRVAPDALAAALDDDVAVLSLSHVNYKTGVMHDMAALTRAAHAHGVLVCWDLSHSAGCMPLDLDGCDADFAVGCGYKFLNGGPGAPAFLFVAERLQEEARQPLTGWLGHAAPFEFEPHYRPAPGIARHLCGTPPILGLAALDAALDVLLAADLILVRAKSARLGDLFLQLVAQECAGHDLQVACPQESERRGSQVCLRHPGGYAIVQALITQGVIGDFRTPDVLRFGMAPLYLRYVDLWDAIRILREIMERGTWKSAEFQRRGAVT